MTRFIVDTIRENIGTGEYRKDDDGNDVQIYTSVYSQITLRDTMNIYHEQEFKEFCFAQRCADALNIVQEAS